MDTKRRDTHGLRNSMSKARHRQTNCAPMAIPRDHRLCVALSELTLAKHPAEFTRMKELHAAIKALAREAARSDHANPSS